MHVVDLFLQKGATIGDCPRGTKKAGQENTKNLSNTELSDTELFDDNLIIEAKAYPNPFTDMLKLNILSEMEGELELLIYSTTGILVHAESRTINEGRSQVELELGLLKPGMYILKVMGIDGASSNIRIIKE